MLKLTLRDLLFSLVIIALLLAYFTKTQPPKPTVASGTNALKTVEGPLRYSYWVTKGTSGWGNRMWGDATKIEFFDGFILVTDNNSTNFIPQEYLDSFRYRPDPNAKTSQNQGTNGNANASHSAH